VLIAQLYPTALSASIARSAFNAKMDFTPPVVAVAAPALQIVKYAHPRVLTAPNVSKVTMSIHQLLILALYAKLAV